jgi:hypothetical protein
VGQAIAVSCVTPASGGVVAQCAPPSVLRAAKAPPGVELSWPPAPIQTSCDVQMTLSSGAASALGITWPDVASTGVVVLEVVGKVEVLWAVFL